MNLTVEQLKELIKNNLAIYEYRGMDILLNNNDWYSRTMDLFLKQYPEYENICFIYEYGADNWEIDNNCSTNNLDIEDQTQAIQSFTWLFNTINNSDLELLIDIICDKLKSDIFDLQIKGEI